MMVFLLSKLPPHQHPVTKFSTITIIEGKIDFESSFVTLIKQFRYDFVFSLVDQIQDRWQ
jgi:hypothetical protein